MDFGFTPEQIALRQQFDDFFRSEMRSAPAEWWTSLEAIYSSDDCWEFHKGVARKLGAKGWLSRPWPAQYGGQDAPLIEQFIFSDVMGYHKGAGVDPLGVGVLAPTLLVSGNDDQKREHLPPLSRGERFWCQCWSEPNSGSDLASLVTRATKVGDEYVIDGQKIWTTGAHRADWCNMLARTNPDERRSRGLSFFLVDMRSPGITVKPIRFMEGSHMFNEVYFDNVRVPARNMVGEENQGWLASQMTSNFERSMIAVFSACKRDLEELAEFCAETRLGGGTLAANPLVRHRLAQLSIEIEAGCTFAYAVVWNQVRGGLVAAGPMAAAAKVLASELLQRLTYTACDIMGLYGQVKDSRWGMMRGRYGRDYQLCLGLNMGGGTSEVMRNLISSMALGLPRSW
jgi:alkylation response protein AidB-like acyl-CoA dehydrogenase